MTQYLRVLLYTVALPGLGLALLWSSATAADDPLGLFVGHWKVSVSHIKPEPMQISYTETYTRVLDDKYIRGETGRKPDGSKDIVLATHDENAGGYPFWIFSSTGSYTYLAPATWDAGKRVMKWKNPASFDVTYQSQCEFPSADLRACHLVMKDWKGKVLSEMRWTAQRIAD